MATVPVLLLLLSAVSPPAQSRQSTFHIIKKEIKWAETRAACKKNFTDLVTVYSEEENKVLADLRVKDNFNWIGLYRDQSVISVKWSNGDPVTYNNLPAHDGSEYPVCAAMRAGGLWERLNCTEQRNFMCYKEGVSPEYHLIQEKQPWYEAQSFCRRNFTDLVSIRDEKQNEEVKNEGSDSTEPFWIGLLRDAWHWADGGNSAYRNWDSKEPKRNNENDKNDCVKMKNGKWSTVPCEDIYFALCYHTSIYVSSGKMSWEEALDHCQEGNRSGILQVRSDLERQDVEAELSRRRVREPVWVGLRQSVLFGFWLWSDGAAASPYTNWYGGEEPEHQNSHHCGAIDPQKDFTWCDRDCESTFRVLCRV